jgi:hypothetical protein
VSLVVGCTQGSRCFPKSLAAMTERPTSPQSSGKRRMVKRSRKCRREMAALIAA